MPDLTGIPRSLRAQTRRLRIAGVPAMLCHPSLEENSDDFSTLPARPWLFWMHGRTVTKEMDPGRFLRLVRRGIACVSVDLPGHGERFDEALQAPRAAMRVIATMLPEIDHVVDGLLELGGFDAERRALGGMSAGGMTALARLCRPHRFTCAVVECTTGSWRGQANLIPPDDSALAALGRELDPIEHLEHWRSIPLLALHNRFDEWVPLAGQEEFLDALAARSKDPSLIERCIYERTGAPNEHAGFGRMGADAKDRVAEFLARRLAVEA